MTRSLLIQDKPSCNRRFAKESPKAQCIHHWLIEPPTSPVSKGVCKKCGEEREFHNDYTPDTHWDSCPRRGIFTN